MLVLLCNNPHRKVYNNIHNKNPGHDTTRHALEIDPPPLSPIKRALYYLELCATWLGSHLDTQGPPDVMETGM